MDNPALSSLANKASNLSQTVVLLIAMALLAGVVGFLLGGTFGLILAIGMTLFGLFVGQQASAGIVLRMYKARPIDPRQAPELSMIYQQLCDRAGLSTHPRLYYVPSRIANAFAVGKGSSSAVAVTDGLMRMMNPREIAGILAHEITHVRCRDTSVLGFADIISRTISAISRGGLFLMLFGMGEFMQRGAFMFLVTGAVLFFAPTLAVMLQLALSRTREFNADRGAAELTGDPIGLASALAKLERSTGGGFWKKLLRPGMRRQQPAMLRTHPPTQDRIAALRGIEQELKSSKPVEPIRIPQSRRVVPASVVRVRQRPRYNFLSGLWK